ncbi:MAG: hypothetical protein QME52_04120, partial [Bacteroidota bacterium]|nr:hypothetical protein [Bacteroidota bacterium]
MKNLLSILVVLVLFFSGCDLITDRPDKPPPPSEKDLIISEVFTISPDKYYAYSWIEIYNPTKKIINWYDYIRPANIFAVGMNGTILFSNDNGENWQDKSPSGIPDHIRKKNFHAISFNTFTRGGAIVGDSGYILKVNGTALGDFSFDTVTNPVFGKTLRDVYFARENRKTGYAVGDSCTIIMTTNLGKTWSNNIPGPRPTHHNLHAIHLEEDRWPKMVAVGESGTILRGR